MAAYDQPGFVSPLPGNPGFQHTDSPRGPGTAPELAPEMTGTSVPVTAPGGRPTDDTANVDQYDTLTPSQEGLYRGKELISGVDGIGQTGAGTGRAGHFDHPNAGQ